MSKSITFQWTCTFGADFPGQCPWSGYKKEFPKLPRLPCTCCDDVRAWGRGWVHQVEKTSARIRESLSFFLSQVLLITLTCSVLGSDLLPLAFQRRAGRERLGGCLRMICQGWASLNSVCFLRTHRPHLEPKSKSFGHEAELTECSILSLLTKAGSLSKRLQWNHSIYLALRLLAMK